MFFFHLEPFDHDGTMIFIKELTYLGSEASIWNMMVIWFVFWLSVDEKYINSAHSTHLYNVYDLWHYYTLKCDLIEEFCAMLYFCSVIYDTGINRLSINGDLIMLWIGVGVCVAVGGLLGDSNGESNLVTTINTTGFCATTLFVVAYQFCGSSVVSLSILT